MRLEKIYHRSLEEDEITLKKGYLNSNKKLWASPMTFSEYEQYAKEGLIVQSPMSYLYKKHSKKGHGNTVDYAISSSNVSISLHRRYSYPVLHNHDYIEMIYVAAGSCEHQFEDAMCHMKEGDVCILAPNAFHALSCTNDESCILNIMVSKKFFDQNFLSVLSEKKLIADFLEKILYQRTTCPYILFPTGIDPWLHELSSRLLTENVQTRQAYEYAISLLTSQFLLHLTREYEVLAIVPNKQSTTQNDLIVSLLGYLSVNYNRTTLAETANFFGYSQAYLSRTIHENIGKTYNTIVAELQMEHAVKLLKTTSLSFTEIAQEVGCFDSSHFNKKFKAIYGITPRQYRLNETSSM